ncbi:MAG: MATE family efflux transporter [Eubacteriales bacterium]|nr:MATE family efflux transporter [Eubacteriales bacterium]
MGVMSVNRLLISMSVPMMISMLVQAMYNIVDSMFVAQLNENALTAVSLAFPVQNLMIAVGSGTGVGLNALVSRSLGEKNTEYANRAANNGIYLSLFSFLAFALLTGCFGGAFFSVQTSDPEILKYGTAYIRICGMMSFGLFFQFVTERLLQSTGKTIYTMFTQSLGAVINIILDPIMIFGLFGFPRLEVAGAALATVTGQIIASLLGFWFNKHKNTELTIAPRKYRLSASVVKNIYSVGIPSIIMMSISSIMTFGMNKILMAFTSTATAVFGVYFKLQSFVFMPIFGMNNGMVPIVAYNYGARKPDRIMKTIRLAITYAVCIMLLGLAAFQILPGLLLRIFNASDTMLEIGTPALRIISVHFLLAGFSIVCSSSFQALGHGVLSLIVSVLRQLFVLLPSAYILSRLGGLTAIWWSFPIAEVVSALVCALFLRYLYKNEISPMQFTGTR